jgi:uncharacterized glyoxalase superfamily protein PhnB
MPTESATPFRARALTASLTAKDLSKSVAWYHDVVGFTIDREIERNGQVQAVVLTSGEVRLLIGQDDGAKGWERTKGEGLSLQFTTDERVDDIADRIKAKGGTLDTEPADMPWGARAFRVRDPDGFKLSFSSVVAR